MKRRLYPQAPHKDPLKVTPDHRLAAICFLASGTIAVHLGIYMAAGVSGALISLGLEACAIGALILRQ